MTFLDNFFSFKSAWIFACAFQLSSKPFPCIFLAGLHFVSEKNEDKILKRAQWNATKPNKSISVKKNTGECFSIKLKSTYKNSGTFEGKKFYLKKSLTSLLHQAIQLFSNTNYTCISVWKELVDSIKLPPRQQSIVPTKRKTVSGLEESAAPLSQTSRFSFWASNLLVFILTCPMGERSGTSSTNYIFIKRTN